MPSSLPQRKTLGFLLLSALLLFTAGMNTISLQSLDDAFYARKGVEMRRSGNFFTVTMAGDPAFQNPPLQVWIMGRSFALFGENDAAARVPFVVMAMGLLMVTTRLGTLTVGQPSGLIAAALLLLTPLFISAARGTMMEIPYGWWVTVAFWCFIEGAAETRANVRTRWHLAMAVPIGAAMLTKSVLGLVPMMAIPVALLLSRDLRRRCGAAMWAGLALGAAIGASWPLQQWMRYGPVALQQHFLGQVLGPSTQQMGLMSRLIGYPIILVRSFEPIVWPALAGVIVWERRWWRERNHTTRTRNTPTAVDARMHPVPAHAPSLAAGKGDGRHRDAQDGDGWERDWRGAVLIAWLVVPIVIASASSAQSSRYIFPILVPLALLAARWLLDVVPRVAVFVTRVFAPALSCVVAASLWIQPSLLTRDQNRVLKMEAQRLQQEIAPTATVSFIGTRYWRVANPFTFYVDRWLNPLETPADVCKDTTIAYLFVETGQADRLKRECPVSGPTILTSPDWILMKIEQRPRP